MAAGRSVTSLFAQGSPRRLLARVETARTDFLVYPVQARKRAVQEGVNRQQPAHQRFFSRNSPLQEPYTIEKCVSLAQSEAPSEPSLAQAPLHKQKLLQLISAFSAKTHPCTSKRLKCFPHAQLRHADERRHAKYMLQGSIRS
eukprot:483193-Pelagomonas_calceolata.AAC.9